MPDKELKDSELIRILNSRKSEADFFDQNELSTQRQLSNYAYTNLQERALKPTTNSTKVIVNKVKPAVDTLTAYLTKIFASDKETVAFTPSTPELSDVSKQIMGMVNHVVHKENNGYRLINRWVKDAAMNKNGVVKVVWMNDAESYREELENVSEEELYVYISELETLGKEVEIESEVEVEAAIIEEDIMLQASTNTYSLRITNPKGRILIENLPPEEFLINKEATSIDKDDNTFAFAAHNKLMFISDVMEMFPDVDQEELMTISSSSDFLDYDSETEARHLFDGTFDYFTEDGNTKDMRQVEITEAWLKYDYNDDGFSEWRHVWFAGDMIIMNDEWTGMIPFFSFCFFPIPHKFYGMSVYDSIKDYYFQTTALARGMIDNIQRANNPKVIFNPRDIPERNLTQAKTGYVAGAKTFQGGNTSMSVIPHNPANPLGIQMMEVVEKWIEEHLGINPRTGAISADVEASGNDAIKTSMVLDNASTKVEMYAREFAEEAMRPMVWHIVRLLVENKDNHNVQRLAVKASGTEFLAGLPGMMDNFSIADLTAKVGLGHLNQQQKILAMQTISAKQAELTAQGIMIPPDKSLALAYELSKALGYENVYDFFPTVEESGQLQQMVESATQQGLQQGMIQGQQQAMQQLQSQEVAKKIQKMDSEIANLNAKTETEMTEADATRREVLIKEKEQMLEEWVAMNADTTTAAALI